LASETGKIPTGARWVHEIKFDGYRLLVSVEDGKATLRSRRGNDWTSRFAPAAAALGRLAARSALVDGELVALDEKGRSDFQELQNALSAGDPGRLVYFAFDLLFLDGYDLRASPLLERKAALKKLLSESGKRAAKEFRARVRYTDHVDGQGERLFRKACALSLEGVVSKRKDAPYRAGRSDLWTKVKCLQEQEFVIAGFTEPSGSRAGFGALLLGVRERGVLRYAGRVGTGFSTSSLRELHARLKKLKTAKPAFANPPTGADARGAHWIRPELVAQVAFHGWTRDAVLRQASFKGLREDKGAEEVVIERPKPAPRAAAPAPRARLTHPERVLYPELGLTKRELADFYEAIGDRILPHLIRRPLAIIRCPNGRDKGCFFQKHGTRETPDAIKSVSVREKKGGMERDLYIEDLDGLLALVQVGALELHPWGCRIEDVERPDRVVFDLDPSPGVAWGRVLDAARELRRRLMALGLDSFVKTTGGKGLHVVIPIDPRETWPRVKAWTKAFVQLLADDEPKLYTARLPKAERVGLIFVDYLRNERGSTAVCAYSTRAREGAPVSTPVAWEELKPSLRPDRWTVRNLPARLRSVADPWARFFSVRQILPLPPER
jgi:bifunctional non-homologous end joining protein LigD